MKAQGALEYLVIIATALAITAVVTSLVITYFAPQQAQYNYATCRQAASTCKTTMSTNPNDACAVCNSACNYSNGTEIFPGAIKCCRFGNSTSIYEGSSGCTGCFADTDCTSTPLTPHCYNSTRTCVECAKDSDCLLNPNGHTCSASTHTCISACRLDSDCTGSQICCNHQCKTPCITQQDCTAGLTIACIMDYDTGQLGVTCENAGKCDSECVVTNANVGTQCSYYDDPNRFCDYSWMCRQCVHRHSILCNATGECNVAGSSYRTCWLCGQNQICSGSTDVEGTGGCISSTGSCITTADPIALTAAAYYYTSFYNPGTGTPCGQQIDCYASGGGCSSNQASGYCWDGDYCKSAPVAPSCTGGRDWTSGHQCSNGYCGSSPYTSCYDKYTAGSSLYSGCFHCFNGNADCYSCGYGNVKVKEGYCCPTGTTYISAYDVCCPAGFPNYYNNKCNV